MSLKVTASVAAILALGATSAAARDQVQITGSSTVQNSGPLAKPRSSN